MHIGCETGQILPKLIVTDAVPVFRASRFKGSCKEMIIAILEKVLEKIPLNPPISTNSCVFDPQ